MDMDQEALKKIEQLREERDYYKLSADLLQERLESTESALKVAKAQLAMLRVDRRVEVG